MAAQVPEGIYVNGEYIPAKPVDVTKASTIPNGYIVIDGNMSDEKIQDLANKTQDEIAVWLKSLEESKDV